MTTLAATARTWWGERAAEVSPTRHAPRRSAPCERYCSLFVPFMLERLRRPQTPRKLPLFARRVALSAGGDLPAMTAPGARRNGTSEQRSKGVLVRTRHAHCVAPRGGKRPPGLYAALSASARFNAAGAETIKISKLPNGDDGCCFGEPRVVPNGIDGLGPVLDCDIELQTCHSGSRRPPVEPSHLNHPSLRHASALPMRPLVISLHRACQFAETLQQWLTREGLCGDARTHGYPP